MPSKISFLTSRDIRSVWRREDKNFTPWLANVEPIARLFEACGLELGEDPKIETEREIPGVRRSLDVLVTIEGEDSVEKFAIENQYSEGDHDHLTRALAYAVGLDVSTVIIVAESHRPEFVSVVNYLNAAAATYERGIRVFLVDITVWSADDGETVFPVFEVSAEPDEWKALVSKSVGSERETEMKALNYEFHDLMLPLVRKTTGVFKNSKPSSSSSWKAGWFGIGGVAVVYGFLKDYSYAQVWFFRHGDPEASRRGFEALKAQRVAIENEYSDLEFVWKEDRGYPVVETYVKGLGADRPFDPKKLQQLAEVTGKMSEIVNRYKGEIVDVMGEDLTRRKASQE